ncbi:hypothetical protein ABVT39_007157, partial [Epinephelus coioides]
QVQGKGSRERGEDGGMEEVKVWKEVQQQQQQLSANEVPGSHYKPVPTDIARGRPRCLTMFHSRHQLRCLNRKMLPAD